jgi:NADPH:quinone reductase-like Zn-dependent oxidoreductase
LTRAAIAFFRDRLPGEDLELGKRVLVTGATSSLASSLAAWS